MSEGERKSGSEPQPNRGSFDAGHTAPTATESEPADKAHAMLRDIVKWLGAGWHPCPVCNPKKCG